MKVKAGAQDILSKKKFLLLRIVLFFIVVFINFHSIAHAAWNNQEDPNINRSPKDQGWKLMTFQKLQPIKQEPSVSLAER